MDLIVQFVLPIASLRTAGSLMADLCEPMLDAVFLAAHFEHVSHKACSWTIGVAWRQAKLDAVVGQEGMDPVWHGLDERGQQRRGGDAFDLVHQPGKGGLAGSINCDEAMSLPSLHLGEVDMKVTDRACLKRLFSPPPPIPGRRRMP